MASRSPRMTFEPTPALEENKENFSPLNQMYTNKSTDDDYFETERRSRGVRFSDPPDTDVPRRSQSIATISAPLLQSVSSASQIPKQSMRPKAGGPEVDINAYFEHSRSLLDTLRLNHERDKKAFDEERKLWNTERSVLKARIADLEFKLNKSSNGKRRYSNESTTTGAQVFRADFGSSTKLNSAPTRTRSVPTTNGGPPVWEGPKQTPPVTRVFSNESDQANPPANHLTSISEDEASTFPELTQEISPTSTAPAKAEPVPIDKIDSTLDGITLKSTALAPSFVARVMTPTQTGSPARSPSPRARQPHSNSQSPPNDANGHSSLSLNMNSLLSPLDEKLKRHAGHTPMAFDGPAAFYSAAGSSEAPTPKGDKPLAPAPITRPPLRPSEDSDTYFSFSETSKDQEVPLLEEAVETDDGQTGWITELESEDPELKGPLMLDPKNDSGSSSEFLDKVDAKLIEAAMTSRKDSVLSSSDRGEGNGEAEGSANETDRKKKDEGFAGSAEAEKDFEMPKLRMRKSLNFGSAYGFNRPGSRW